MEWIVAKSRFTDAKRTFKEPPARPQILLDRELHPVPKAKSVSAARFHDVSWTVGRRHRPTDHHYFMGEQADTTTPSTSSTCWPSDASTSSLSSPFSTDAIVSRSTRASCLSPSATCRVAPSPCFKISLDLPGRCPDRRVLLVFSPARALRPGFHGGLVTMKRRNENEPRLAVPSGHVV